MTLKGAPRIPGTDSSQTHRWREMDSNFKFRRQIGDALRCPRTLIAPTVIPRPVSNKGSSAVPDGDRLAPIKLMTYGEQEGSAYNGHFGCTCYHPLFVCSTSSAMWSDAPCAQGTFTAPMAGARCWNR